jgi:hypothetical protein
MITMQVELAGLAFPSQDKADSSPNP